MTLNLKYRDMQKISIIGPTVFAQKNNEIFKHVPIDFWFFQKLRDIIENR